MIRFCLIRNLHFQESGRFLLCGKNAEAFLNELMGAVSAWMAMGALMAGMQPGLAVWQKEYFIMNKEQLPVRDHYT